MMTLERLASIESIERIVGNRPTSRWNRSSPTLKRSDGESRESWFGGHSPSQRVRLVREFLLDSGEWGALRRFKVPKAGKEGYRCIDVPTVLGQAAQYVLHPWLQESVEARLGKWCLAYRRNQKFHVNCRRVHKLVKRCPWVQTVDVVDFFGSLKHSRLDTLMDSLDADDALKSLLSRLWRVAIQDRRGGPVRTHQGRGIGQGLVLSPAIANLYSTAAWTDINRQISSRSSAAPYFCDDGLVAAPRDGQVQPCVDATVEGLAAIALTTTLGPIVDVREEPVEWLGLLFGDQSLDVSDRRIALKVSQWDHLVQQDQLSREGLNNSMKGLLTHYRKLLPATRIFDIQRQLEEGMDSIVFPPSEGRKEVTFLQSLRG